MAEALLYHHAQGLTPGIHAFADELRAAGHTVHTPDLFDGQTFGSIDEGMAHIKSVGFEALRARGVALADVYPNELVYAGFSFGESIAQQLAQTQPGARGALLFYSCIPITGEWAFGPWPDGVPVQIHGKEGDEFFEEDLPAARELVEIVGPDLAELFVYPGDAHLFTDRSLPAYDPEAADLVLQRSLAFLDGL